MPRTLWAALVQLRVVTARAVRTIRPAAHKQIDPAGPLIGKEPVELSERHLLHKLCGGLFATAHDQNFSKNPAGSQHPSNPHLGGD